jgi:hypothetical protein
MKKYHIYESRKEIPYIPISEFEPGVIQYYINEYYHWDNPSIEEEFDNYEKAVECFKKNYGRSSASLRSGSAGLFYNAKEYYLSEDTYDEDGDIEDGNELMISNFFFEIYDLNGNVVSSQFDSYDKAKSCVCDLAKKNNLNENDYEIKLAI